MRYLLAVAIVLSLAVQSPVQAQASFDTKAVLASIDARARGYGDVALQIWKFAEVGYQEQKSSALLQEQLRSAGFTVKAGVAEIPTAFTAEWGSGKPVIGIVGEFDALPGLSQAAEPERHALEAEGPGHGCGHHLFGTASTAAAIAVKEWLVANKHAGTLRFYGTPAEEGGAGKVYMLRAGLFDDVDAVVTMHPGDRNASSASSSLANITGKFRFRGVSAHASAAPDRGRSALDCGRGDERHGQPDARARAVGHAHPLRHHQRRQGAERGAGFRRGPTTTRATTTCACSTASGSASPTPRAARRSARARRWNWS